MLSERSLYEKNYILSDSNYKIFYKTNRRVNTMIIVCQEFGEKMEERIGGAQKIFRAVRYSV